MATRSHQLGRGSVKAHLAYVRMRRAEAAAAVAAAEQPPSCPACRGKKRAHTCGKGLKKPRAAPGTAAATAARLGDGEDAGSDDDDDDGALADGMMHAVRRGDDLEWLRDPNMLAAQAAERERAQVGPTERPRRPACRATAHNLPNPARTN